MIVDAQEIIAFERRLGTKRAAACKRLANYIFHIAATQSASFLVDDDVRCEFEFGAKLLGRRASPAYDECVSRFLDLADDEEHGAFQ